MYIIQAYNRRTKHTHTHRCDTMEERAAYIGQLLASGDYVEAGISWEWIARGYD